MKVDEDHKLDCLNLRCPGSIGMAMFAQQAGGAMGLKLRRETWASHGNLELPFFSVFS